MSRLRRRRVSPEIAAEAVRLARSVAEALDYVGVLAVEMFVLGDGRVLVNEIAPRPHNSGHYTIDACVTNQFEQQLRAVTGLPLGDPAQHTPAVMVNLLGDLWPGETESPDWTPLLATRARNSTSTASAVRSRGARWATSPSSVIR